jgi:sarcosine oxidase
MSDTYDVIVVGLGGMGSATVYHLARRGVRVLGLERFLPGHTNGSSHGDSRIIRELYYEHPLYVPLVRRAYELWADLAYESGTALLHLTGGLMMGPRGARIVAGSREAAVEHGLPFDELTAEDIRARFPALRPPDDYTGLWDVRAGYLEPETATLAHLRLAERHGAVLRLGEAVVRWARDGDGVTVTTAAERYRAERLVLTAGAWTSRLVPDLALPLVIERQVLVWLDPPSAAPDPFAADHFPIFLCEYEPHRAVYGFPRLAGGVKASVYHEGEVVADPDGVRRSIDPAEIDRLRSALAPLIPSLARAPVRSSTTCVFTNTPDARFVIDWHPTHANVLIVSPCSGHGFKFAAAIGEVNADLITGRAPVVALDPFAIRRFGRTPS